MIRPSDREPRDLREVQSDTVSEEALILLERLVASPEVMNAKQAAEFIGITYNAFRQIAPGLPRHNIGQRSYRYVKRELLEWVLSQ